MGSPPHTREEYVLKEVYGQDNGITPAYAGRIVVINCDKRNIGDHPRIRGKNLILINFTGNFLGSPPHTREEYTSKRFCAMCNRITPAYAGRMASKQCTGCH